MTEHPSLQDVSSFVADHYGETASAPVLLGAGEWSKAYAFRLGDQDLVIRFGNHPEDFAKDALVGAWAPPGVPVPKVVELGESAVGYYAVAERRNGEFLDALDEPRMRAVLPSVFGLLDALAEMDVSGTAGYGMWGPTGDAPFESWPEALLAINEDRPRIGDWRAALERSPIGIESFDLGLCALRELSLQLPDLRQVIHGDLLNRNVLVENGRVAAALDWGNSMYGDALYDAAWLVYWWGWFPAWVGIDVEAELMNHWHSRGPVAEEVRTRLLAYRIHIGLDDLSYIAAKGRSPDDLRRTDEHVRELCRRVP